MKIERKFFQIYCVILAREDTNAPMKQIGPTRETGEAIELEIELPGDSKLSNSNLIRKRVEFE